MKSATVLTLVFLGLALPAFAIVAADRGATPSLAPLTAKSISELSMTPVRNLRG